MSSYAMIDIIKLSYGEIFIIVFKFAIADFLPKFLLLFFTSTLLHELAHVITTCAFNLIKKRKTSYVRIVCNGKNPQTISYSYEFLSLHKNEPHYKKWLIVILLSGYFIESVYTIILLVLSLKFHNCALLLAIIIYMVYLLITIPASNDYNFSKDTSRFYFALFHIFSFST